MVQINSVLLKKFYQQGISINKGVAVDARLVKSASKPTSKKKIKVLKEKQDRNEKNQIDKDSITVYWRLKTITKFYRYLLNFDQTKVMNTCIIMTSPFNSKLF